jgi:hypothetical protein
LVNDRSETMNTTLRQTLTATLFCSAIVAASSAVAGGILGGVGGGAGGGVGGAGSLRVPSLPTTPPAHLPSGGFGRADASVNAGVNADIDAQDAVDLGSGVVRKAEDRADATLDDAAATANGAPRRIVRIVNHNGVAVDGAVVAGGGTNAEAGGSAAVAVDLRGAANATSGVLSTAASTTASARDTVEDQAKGAIDAAGGTAGAATVEADAQANAKATAESDGWFDIF